MQSLHDQDSTTKIRFYPIGVLSRKKYVFHQYKICTINKLYLFERDLLSYKLRVYLAALSFACNKPFSITISFLNLIVCLLFYCFLVARQYFVLLQDV